MAEHARLPWAVQWARRYAASLPAERVDDAIYRRISATEESCAEQRSARGSQPAAKNFASCRGRYA